MKTNRKLPVHVAPWLLPPSVLRVMTGTTTTGTKKHNKIVLAADMYVEAFKRYRDAKCDVDYVTCLILAGAVCGIVGPLLKEQGATTLHDVMAGAFEGVQEGMMRTVYNGLKHGGKRNAVSPSDDLVIYADLPAEAVMMLQAAHDDITNVAIDADVVEQLSPEFLRMFGRSTDSDADSGKRRTRRR